MDKTDRHENRLNGQSIGETYVMATEVIPASPPTISLCSGRSCCFPPATGVPACQHRTQEECGRGGGGSAEPSLKFGGRVRTAAYVSIVVRTRIWENVLWVSLALAQVCAFMLVWRVPGCLPAASRTRRNMQTGCQRREIPASSWRRCL